MSTEVGTNTDALAEFLKVCIDLVAKHDSAMKAIGFPQCGCSACVVLRPAIDKASAR